MTTTLLVLIFPLATIVTGVSDLLTMRIPNQFSFGLAIAFVPCALLADLPLSVLSMHVAVGLAVLAFTFVLFSLGWIGGGDAKMAAAIVLWLGPGLLPEFTLITALHGGLLTLALLAVRSIPLPAFALGWPWLTRLHHPKTGIPYGVALAAAGLMVYPQSPLLKAAL